MSQTNRTPAGPDRGSIATGQQKPERDGESAAGNGRVVDGAAEPSTTAEKPSPHPGPASADGAAVSGADVVASEEPASGQSTGRPALLTRPSETIAMASPLLVYNA